MSLVCSVQILLLYPIFRFETRYFQNNIHNNPAGAAIVKNLRIIHIVIVNTVEKERNVSTHQVFGIFSAVFLVNSVQTSVYACWRKCYKSR